MEETKRIKHLEKPFSQKQVLKILDPLVKEWFFSRFDDFSLPQLYGVLPIHQRKNILISAPTGGTKTLTAFLSIINYLVSLARKNELENKVYCIYVSPLKALNNDVFVNLQKPLDDINKIAASKRVKLQKIKVAVRTGDTPTSERQKMLKQTPHILITTPETLGIILSTKKFIEKFKAVEYVIIDEIHALANKRGVHTSLSLERLHELSIIKPSRIGLSATIQPLDEVAKFLVGYEYDDGKFKPRECLIADVQFAKKINVKVISPKNLFEKNHNELYSLINGIIQKHKTTLIFTNTRSATERVVNHLKEMFPKKYIENIGAHHSSISRTLRFNIEQRLREGKLKVIVSSTSLELGIDIGYIDSVILLGSPKSVARCMQRIGRSGHKLNDKAKGFMIVLDRDDLVECSVMARQIKLKHIDKIDIPKGCLDVLAQQMFGSAIQKIWHIDDFFKLIRQSYCYNRLDYNDYLAVLSYLAGEYALESKNIYAKTWYDKTTKQFGKRGKLARMLYMTNIGTIPEESFINVIITTPNEKKGLNIGVIDESFLDRLRQGDVFVLGGHKYKYLYSKGSNIYVNASIQQPPTIPSWFSEMLPLSFDLAIDIQHFRKLLAEMFEKGKSENETIEFIQNYLSLNKKEAKQIYDYFYEQHNFAKIPHETRLLIERYRDNKGKLYVIFHSLYGRRVNDALSRAVAFLLAKTGRRDVEIGINDNGFFVASYGKMQVDKTIKMLIEKPILRDILEQAIEKTQTFKRHFRHCTTRALMILRNYKGKSKTVKKQQMKSNFLFYAVKQISKEFPRLKETRREILEDVMDIKNATLVLKWLNQGKLKTETINTDLPSPFSITLVTQGYTDLLKIEDKIEFLKRVHEEIMMRIKNIGGKKD